MPSLSPRAIKFSTLTLVLCGVAYLLFLLVPLLLLNMTGEEGAFAYLLTGNHVGKQVIWNGYVNGVDFVNLTEHPIILYYVMVSLGPIVKEIFGNHIDEVVAFRTIPAIVYVGFVLVCLYFLRKFKTIYLKVLATAVIFTGCFYLVDLGMLQTDTLIGFPLFIVAITMYFFAVEQKMNFNFRVSSLFLFLSGIFMGIGKQEWAIASLIAILAALLYYGIFSLLNSRSHSLLDLWQLWVLGLGLLFGIVTSYALDPDAYIGGFRVIARTVFDPISNEGFSVARYIEVTYPRIGAFSFFGSLILMYLIITFKQKHVILSSKLIQAFPGVLMFFNLAPSAVSSWSAETRYMAPVAAIAVSLPIFIQANLPNRIRTWRFTELRITALLFCLILAVTADKFANSVRELNRFSEHQVSDLIAKQNWEADCVYRVDPSIGYYSNRKLNWVNSWLGEEGVVSYFSVMKKTLQDESLRLCELELSK